jgi:Domain of unknown function (DUF1413)
MKITINLTPPLVKWVNNLEKPITAEDAILAVLNKNIGISPVDKALLEFQEALKNFPSNIEFEIPQVFGSAQWGQLDRSTKLSLGKRIKAEASSLGITFLHKTVTNHAVYSRQQ